MEDTGLPQGTSEAGPCGGSMLKFEYAAVLCDRIIELRRRNDRGALRLSGFAAGMLSRREI